MQRWHKHGAEQIRANDLWVVPNGGHGPVFGNMTAQFVGIALAFLREEWAGS
jgi:hypothetical protein